MIKVRHFNIKKMVTFMAFISFLAFIAFIAFIAFMARGMVKKGRK